MASDEEIDDSFAGEEEGPEDGASEQVTGDNSPDSDDGALKEGVSNVEEDDDYEPEDSRKKKKGKKRKARSEDKKVKKRKKKKKNESGDGWIK